jgi:soluble lytic murein transglycosylase-like protein
MWRSLRKPVLALAALAALAASPRAEAEHIYRWVDADGVIHITNIPQGGKRSARKHVADPELSHYSPGPEAPLEFQPNDVTARYDPYIKEACAQYHIPPALVRAVMNAESNFNPQAMSNKGAMGLMQLMPATGDEMFVTRLTDPRDNILGGVRYLRVLTNLFDGDMVKIVAAYNAGPRAVWDAGGVPDIPETQDYVRKVLRLYFSYKNPAAR